MCVSVPVSKKEAAVKPRRLRSSRCLTGRKEKVRTVCFSYLSPPETVALVLDIDTPPTQGLDPSSQTSARDD